MSPFDFALAQIDDADIPTTVYRTAIRLLTKADELFGHVRLTKAEMMALCGTEKEGTMRAHLWRLAAVGIIHYSTNRDVYVNFHAYADGDQPRAQNNPTRAENNPTRAQRAVVCSDSTDEDNDRALSARDEASSQQNRALSTNIRALSDQIDPATYTHAGGRVVVVVDPDPSNEKEGITTTTTTNPPNPTEQALSVALLAHVGLKPMAATKRLAAEHPFGRIRDCVAYWWTQRKCVGGRFEDAPLIVLHWLDHWDTAMIPPMPPEFRRTDLYHDHCRTPAERQADDEVKAALLADETEAMDIPRPVIERGLPLTPERALWKQITTDYAQLHDATLSVSVEGDRWVITTIMADWCRVQLTRRIERDLKRAGVVATVEFAMKEKEQVTP